MKKYFVFVVLFLISTINHSQTIINIERLYDRSDSTIYSLSFEYEATKGNSITSELAISPAVIYIKKNNNFMVFGGYELLSERVNEIIKNGFIHLRHNYKISNRLQTFEFYQLQFNDELLLDKREVFGAGLKYELFNVAKYKLAIGSGFMKELEILNQNYLQTYESSITNYARFNFIGSLKWIINNYLKIDNITYYQPYLKDFKDYRILNDFSLTLSVSDHIEMIYLLSLRYDSQPPVYLKNLDKELSLILNIKFNK